MPYIDRNEAGNITGIYAVAQREDHEFVEGAVLYVPPQEPIDQIRAIESSPTVRDAMERASRQFLLAAWFARAKALPGATGLTDVQIDIWCRTNDKVYKTLAEAEDAVRPLRAQVV